MITTMSSSNWNMSKNLNKNLTAFKKQQFCALYGFALKKSAGWTVIYSILLFLCYPLIVWKENYETAEFYPNDYADRLSRLTSYQLVTAFLVSALMCIMVLVFSAVLYSYMHGKRSSDFFHSMPVDRSILLGANFAAGLTSLLVPIWLCSLISMFSFPILLPQADWLPICKIMALEMLAWTLGAFALFAISTLVAVTVSTTVENVGYTIALLLEGSILLLIWDLACDTVFETYLSIFDGGDVGSIFGDLLYYLSPVFALGKVIVAIQEKLSHHILGLSMIDEDGWLALLFWFVLGIGALWLAMKLYDKRQSERAEQWGRQSLIGFAVKLMSAIMGAFFFAVVLGDMLGMEERYIYTFGALTGAPLVYMIIEAVTNRGFHNMRKCLPYMGAAVGIILAASLYFVADGFGFDENIPEAESVQTVLLEMDHLQLNSRKGNDEFAKSYILLPDGSYAPIEGNHYLELYELSETETIEQVRKIHQQSLDDSSDYLGFTQVSYENGPVQTNRELILRHDNADNLLELLYSDEFLKKYNPFFEMKADYLEFVQITDKLGNPIGEGEIPAEAWDRLLTAVHTDLKNTEAGSLRDADGNQPLAQLTFVTKYPKEIYESTGDLYHYTTNQSYIVRTSDSNTRKVLEDLGLELKVQDSFYDRMLNLTLYEGYTKGNLPGMAVDGDKNILEKYDYYVGEQQVADQESMKKIVDSMTSVYSGYGDQYALELFSNNENGLQVNAYSFYVDRKVVAEVMVRNNHFVVPYILNKAESELVLEAERQREAEKLGLAEVNNVPLTEEYLSWTEVRELENCTSLLDYCKQYVPSILENKTAAELECMAQTPILHEDGYRIRISF